MSENIFSNSSFTTVRLASTSHVSGAKTSMIELLSCADLSVRACSI